MGTVPKKKKELRFKNNIFYNNIHILRNHFPKPLKMDMDRLTEILSPDIL